MSEYITFIALAAIIVLGLSIATVLIMAYNRKEKLHQQLSNQFGLRGNYVNEKKFKLFGKNRNYKLVIESDNLGGIYDPKKGGNSIKFSIPVTNPTRKCLRILKEDSSNPKLANIVPLDKLLEVKHDMGDWLKIHTNDLVFSSLVLGENARISIVESFKNLNHGAIIYIQDEELACVFPTLLKHKSQLESLYRIAGTLADMKDELN